MLAPFAQSPFAAELDQSAARETVGAQTVAVSALLGPEAVEETVGAEQVAVSAIAPSASLRELVGPRFVPEPVSIKPFGLSPFGGAKTDSGYQEGEPLVAVATSSPRESITEAVGAAPVSVSALQPVSKGVASDTPGTVQVSITSRLGPESVSESVGPASVSVVTNLNSESPAESVGPQPVAVSSFQPGSTGTATDCPQRAHVVVSASRPASVGSAVERLGPLQVRVRGIVNMEWPIWIRRYSRSGYTQARVYGAGHLDDAPVMLSAFGMQPFAGSLSAGSRERAATTFYRVRIRQTNNQVTIQ